MEFTFLDRLLNPVSKARVLIVGSAFVDLLLRVDTLPVSGADVKGDYQDARVGGCSFNVADVFFKLALPCECLLPIGEGMIASLIEKEFNRRHYPLTKFQGKGDNGWCLTLIEKNGERSFITLPGIERRFERAWFDAFDMPCFDYVYLSGYQCVGDNASVMLEGLSRLHERAIVVFDPGPLSASLDPAFTRALERHRVLYTVNASEALALTGQTDVKAAALALAEHTATPAVITHGAEGAFLAKDSSVTLIPGFNITVADTVGSGDSHTGGLMAGLSLGFSLEESVTLGNLVAAWVTSRTGAACAPTVSELRAFSANFRG